MYIGKSPASLQSDVFQISSLFWSAAYILPVTLEALRQFLIFCLSFLCNSMIMIILIDIGK